jgi:lipopolysaccharide/colanic/teichoic acid biosynthesis glycosyltransferase
MVLDSLDTTGQERSDELIPHEMQGQLGDRPIKNSRTIRYIFRYVFWKYNIDRLLALVLSVALAPLLVLIAIAIRLDSPGSPMFLQERVGKNGRRFVISKFRTMYVNNDDSDFKRRASEAILENRQFDKFREDPRVTGLGVILRKTNLDELPQILNVLKGEMAFVGPRPEIPFTMELYRELNRERYWKRLSVKPGITGLWQVRGRGRVTFNDMVGFDIDYVERQSPLLDATILLQTLGTFFGRDGS